MTKQRVDSIPQSGKFPRWASILLKQMSLASRQKPEREELLAGTGRISR